MMVPYVDGGMSNQVPGPLRRLDDPWGVTWRVTNVLRRFDPLWLARFGVGLVRGPTHRRPVFIVGMPRSGTTLLFHLLRESSQLVALRHEGHDIWRLYHHPRYTGWRSDHVGSGEVHWGERRVVNAIFYALAGERRFLEKTADNSVRALLLLELFPDATFIVMKRSPCDVINSYINGWRHPEGRFRSYYVPEDLSIPDYPPRHQWCSTLIEGWRDFAGSPIPEIAFEQWRQYVETVAIARDAVPQGQWLECHLEDLLAEPGIVARRIYEAVGIEDEPRLASKLEELVANPVNAMTPPGQDKWRGQNAEEISAMLPRIAAIAPRIGYNVDPRTGHTELARYSTAVTTPRR